MADSNCGLRKWNEHMTLDFNTIIAVGGLVAVLYIAYKVGSFVLKITIGLVAIGFIGAAATKIWAYMSNWIM